MALLKSLVENPRYTFMRGIARFALVRRGIASLKRVMTDAASKCYEHKIVGNMNATLFPEVNRDRFVADLQKHGCAFGLMLPPRIIDAILRYAESYPVFAFRNETLGFISQERERAQAAVGKEILLAQYFNSERDCKAIREVAADPVLSWIALQYLGSVPHFLGCNLWWTYPVRPNRDDQMEHAHFFHRDIDDFRFIKFFFYITDVEMGDGGHWIVRGSNSRSPHIRFKDRFVTRRFEDHEIAGFYPRADILEVVGPTGTGFAEDTLCIHKAATPSRSPRLMLQLQFGLFDLGVGNDARRSSQLRMIQDAAAIPGISSVAM